MNKILSTFVILFFLQSSLSAGKSNQGSQVNDDLSPEQQEIEIPITVRLADLLIRQFKKLVDVQLAQITLEDSVCNPSMVPLGDDENLLVSLKDNFNYDDQGTKGDVVVRLYNSEIPMNTFEQTRAIGIYEFNLECITCETVLQTIEDNFDGVHMDYDGFNFDVTNVSFDAVVSTQEDPVPEGTFIMSGKIIVNEEMVDTSEFVSVYDNENELNKLGNNSLAKDIDMDIKVMNTGQNKINNDFRLV